jgi:hypothetical protein
MAHGLKRLIVFLMIVCSVLCAVVYVPSVVVAVSGRTAHQVNSKRILHGAHYESTNESEPYSESLVKKSFILWMSKTH